MCFCHFPPAECHSFHDDDVSLEQVGHELTTKQQQKHTQAHDDAGEACRGPVGCGGPGGCGGRPVRVQAGMGASEGPGGDGGPAEGRPVRPAEGCQAGTGGRAGRCPASLHHEGRGDHMSPGPRLPDASPV